MTATGWGGSSRHALRIPAVYKGGCDGGIVEFTNAGLSKPVLKYSRCDVGKAFLWEARRSELGVKEEKE